MPKPAIIAIDFDGTIVEHKYPAIGAPIKGAIDTIKELQARGHRIILWTMRSGRELEKCCDLSSGKWYHPLGCESESRTGLVRQPQSLCSGLYR